MNVDKNQTQNQKDDKNKSILKKSLVGLIIAIVSVSMFLIMGETGIVGKVIAIFFYLGLAVFAAYEFSNILPTPKWVNFYYSILIIGMFFLSWNDLKIWLSDTTNSTNLNYLVRKFYEFSIFDIPGLGYLVMLVFVSIPLCWTKRINLKTLIFCIITFLIMSILSIVSKALIFTNVESIFFLFLLLAIPILCDTFAYFGGMLLGNKIFKNRKLAPKISPNKTIEGAIVGFLVTWLIAFLTFMFVDFDFLNIPKVYLFTLVSVFMPIVAILGDLAFSAIKRFVNIKDFSNIIPSHGGILDRIDSITLTSFVFLSLFIVI